MNHLQNIDGNQNFTWSCLPCDWDMQNGSLSSPDMIDLYDMIYTIWPMTMCIRIMVGHLFKFVEGPSWMIWACLNISCLCLILIFSFTFVLMMISILMIMMSMVMTFMSSPTLAPSSFLMIRFIDLSSSSRWKSWSAFWPYIWSYCHFALFFSVFLFLQTWFAAIALFKLQQYQAASDTCLEARLSTWWTINNDHSSSSPVVWSFLQDFPYSFPPGLSSWTGGSWPSWDSSTLSSSSISSSAWSSLEHLYV